MLCYVLNILDLFTRAIFKNGVTTCPGLLYYNNKSLTQKQPVFCISPWWCFISGRLNVCWWILWATWLQIINSIQQLCVIWLGSGGAGGFIWLALCGRRRGRWLEKRIQLLGFAVSADHLMGVYALLGICWGTGGFRHTGGRWKSWKQSLRIMHIRQVLAK